ncbi:S8 family serine peptidase [Paraconexibacter sp.]|uniref:S8 family serine peptidase n=1 Tax=Paraconexibacter sp. TaxID=2949640 RepID=UPI003565DC8C
MHRPVKAVTAACALALATAASASAAPGDHVPHTVIVKYQPGTSATVLSSLERLVGAQALVGRISANGARVIRVAGSAQAAADRLNRSASVEYAEPDQVMRATAVPNDARFAELYGLHNTGQTGGTPDADVDGPEGWDASGLGAFPSTGGLKVGIVDTGIDKAHEDLNGKTVDCAATTAGVLGIIGGDPVPAESRGCADDNDHGTHVAGTIAAKANNGVGVAGVSFDSPLGICKALHGTLGVGSTAAVANCITYLAGKGNRVISMSLGGGESTTLRQAVQQAWNGGNGSLLIAAAGNDGDGTLNYPAAYPEVVSVAATDDDDQRASFSNANSDVEVAAPGVDILSTKRGGGYVKYSGTSMATPHVSGVAAVIARRGGTPAQWRTKLDTAVDDLGAPGRDPSYGFGRVNLAKAATP